MSITMIDETNSLCSEDSFARIEEEQMRRFFQACDKNGDGYIDSIDLFAICKQLNLEHSLEEVMQGLGADEQGRISYDEFLSRRRALKLEIEAFKNAEPNYSQEYHPSSSDTSAEMASGAWDYDSGLSEPSREPNSLQRLVEAAGGSVTTTNAASLLHLANKLHLAAVGSLHSQITDLTSKLTSVSEERDNLKLKIKKSVSFHKTELLIEQYEERITELHSIIAELKRKLDMKTVDFIEEEEFSDDVNVDPRCDEEVEKEEAMEVQKIVQEESGVIYEIRKKMERLGFQRPMVPLTPMSSDLTFHIGKMEVEIQLVEGNLNRCREENERLVRVLGDYESNMTNLKLALETANSIIELMDTLDIHHQKGHIEIRDSEKLEIRRTIESLKNKKKGFSENVMEFQSYSSESELYCSSGQEQSDVEATLLKQEMYKMMERQRDFKQEINALSGENRVLKSKIHQLEKKCQTLKSGSGRKSSITDNLLESLDKQIHYTKMLKELNDSLLCSLQETKDKYSNAAKEVSKLERDLYCLKKERENEVAVLQEEIEFLRSYPRK